jgi:hypothetical protein
MASVTISSYLTFTSKRFRTALNIAPAFTALYVASGTSATPMYTVNALPLV